MSPLTPKEEAFAMAAENRARQQAMTDKERKDAGEGAIKLVRAPDDPALFSKEFQAEFRSVLEELRGAGVKADASFMTMDSPGAGGGYTGEIIIPIIQYGMPVITGALGAWLTARFGRKIRIKTGDVEVEAPIREALSTEEVKNLVQEAIEAARRPKT